MESHPEFVYVNESVIVPITFLAKPAPSIDEINWNIRSGEDINIMQAEEVRNIRLGWSVIETFAIFKHY